MEYAFNTLKLVYLFIIVTSCFYYVYSPFIVKRCNMCCRCGVFVVSDPPFLELPNSTLEVTEHSVLRVTCLVYAHPPPHSVAWITPGGAIIPSDRLVVPDILRLQGGVYTCQAANTLVTNRGELQHRTASKPVWIFVLREHSFKSYS